MQGASVHPAHAGVAAHPAGTDRRFRTRRRRAVRMRRKSRVLLAQMLLAARGTVHLGGVGRAADQLLKLGVAILASIFVNRHSYSVISTHILSRMARISDEAASSLFARNEKASIFPSRRSTYPDSEITWLSDPVLA